MIRTFQPMEDIRKMLDPMVSIGLYIVQSGDNPELFRIGSAGVRQKQSGSLTKRLGNHASNMPCRDDVNWTEFFRPWRPIWAVQMPNATRLAGRLAEQLLFGTFAVEYFFIPESGESGFVAKADERDAIVDLARSLEPKIDAIVVRQIDDDNRIPWSKNNRALLNARYARPGVARRRPR